MKPNTIRRPDLAAGLTGSIGALGTNFMGPQILPPLVVTKKADTFFKPVFGDKNLVVSIADAKRAIKAAYPRLNYRTTSDSFACQDEGLEDSVDDVQEAQVAQQFSAEQDCANGVFLNLQRAAEIAYATYLQDPSSLFVSYTGGVSIEWNTPATATVYNDVNDAFVTLINRLGGVLPAGVERCLAVSAKVFRNMGATTDLKARRAGGIYNVKSTPMPAFTEAEMAQTLGIEQVFQGRAVNGTTDVWDDEYALAFLRVNGNQLELPALGRTFCWDGDGAAQYICETYREEPKQTVVLVRNNVQRYAFNPICGQLLSNITT